jgi:hypothetical protein
MLLDLLDWPLDGSSSTFANESFILNAVLGGVMIGWGVLMYYLADELQQSPRLLKAKCSEYLFSRFLIRFFA